jgi:formamidopyrimidine-DNA glycosylase
MPELPEIFIFARDMQKELQGRIISGSEILQPKCLNLSPAAFRRATQGAVMEKVGCHGKWIQAQTSRGWLLFNLGMGGELLLRTRQTLPEKYRLILDFQDGSCLVVNFWWFGYVHWARELAAHKMSAKLGPNALDLNLEQFHALLKGRRGGIKNLLLNQARIAGIGNVTVQDPLFRARLHPARTIESLTQDEVAALHAALQHTLRQAIEAGGSQWELNLYGQRGAWDSSYFDIAYREGKPCPVCGTTVEKIKTGATSGYICPQCQPL